MAKKHNPEEEQESPFRVVDRRRFTQEGDSRQEGNNEQNKSASTASQPSGQVQSGDNASADTKKEPAAPTQPPQSLTFDLFIQSLGQQAMMAMGLLPWPDSGLIKTDLQRAREMIDVITLLHEKTKGNLTPDEQKFCEALLYQLHVAFVQIVKKGGGQGDQPKAD